jgi:glycosyltransferase involved in cell wall biosynthesis
MTVVDKKEYSVVVPVYNEEESIQPLWKDLQGVLSQLAKPYEIIFVNDCSSDKSSTILESLAGQFPGIIRNIHLSTRSGQTHAMQEGLKASSGNYVITLDADLQNDPADIPKMLEKMREGYDCVCGWRKSRQDTPLKACLSKFGNVLQRLLTGLSIHDVSCTLRIYKRHCVSAVPLNWEGQHRFIPLALSLQGYKIGEIVSNHRKRSFGVTKYSHKRIFRVVGDFFRILASGGKK